MHHARSTLLAVAVLALGCNKESSDTAKPESISSSGNADKASPKGSTGGASSGASTAPDKSGTPQGSAVLPSASPAPSASGLAATPPPPAPCTVESTTTLDRGALAATGLTTVRLSHTQAAIGYAVGGGTPKVLVVDRTDGKVTHAEVDDGHLRNEEKPKPKMVRVVHRVTPLGTKNGKMRVGVDLIDVSTEKNKARYARCGPADSEPIMEDDSPLNFFEVTEDDVAKLPGGPGGALDMRDCRTFSNGETTWVLATIVQRASTAADNRDLRVSWVVDDKVGKTTIVETEIDHRDIKPQKDKRYPLLDHFETPVSVHAKKDGYVMVSRERGSFVFARRDQALRPAGTPATVQPPAAPGFPSMTHEAERVFLAHTGWQKNDLYAMTFLGAQPPGHSAAVPLTDSHPPTQGSRDMVSIFPSSDGTLFVTFVDDKTNKTGRTRLTILTPELKQKLPDVVDVTDPETQAIEARVVSLSPQKALVTTLAANGDVIGSVVSCK